MQRVLRVATAVVAAFTLAVSAATSQAQSSLPTVPDGFTIERIAGVPAARELAVAANGDLLVGTGRRAVYIVPDATGKPGPASVFVTLSDSPVAGVAIDGERLILGSQFAVWAMPYHAGDRTASAAPKKLASVRTNGGSRDHVTTTVAVANEHLYASVGSSCNNCDPDLDDTRATIQEMQPDGTNMHAKAKHIRNAIALATNPATGTLWAGVAGQDELAHGHPYEMFDAVTLHDGTADYGWPHCYENHRAVDAHDCKNQTVARVVFPAYETPIGAAFYPMKPGAAHAFPDVYRGGAFVTLHGSWHTPPVAPRVAFVPMTGDEPKTAVDWNNPNAQWREFVGGFQSADGNREARPTGVAVAPDGTLFVSEDQGGSIYRIRPKR